MNKKLSAKLKIIPKSAGVYLMKDQTGRVIYVGKAKELNKRVRSYFRANVDEIKTRRLVENIADIDWLLTDSELEALMLETNLIKKYRPRYNILMKDDKNYVYIKITKEGFPRVYLVRKVIKDGAKYFGPYTNSLVVKKVLRSLNRIFPFYTYKNKSGIAPMDSQAGKELFHKRAKSAWGDLTEPQVYNQMIIDLVKFLRGQTKSVTRLFKKEMKRAAEEKNFETAAILRDRIVDINKMTESQRVVSTSKDDIDVLGYYGEDKEWVVSLLSIREGKLIDIKNVLMKGRNLHKGESLLKYFMVDYYQRTTDFPREIYISDQISDKTLIDRFINQQVKNKVKIIQPQRGNKRKLIDLAVKNARIEWMRRRSLKTFARKDGESLVELIDLLKASGVIFDEKFHETGVFRIEGYDISNLGDSGVVGAMVVWELKLKSQNSNVKNTKIGSKRNAKERSLTKMDLIKKGIGGFNKKLYKRFEIKSFRGQDDFAAMSEVLKRRFSHQEKGWIWPNLVLIDGGKGQLGAVLRIMAKKKVDVPVIGLAKREEEVWLGKLKINKSEELHLGDIVFWKIDLDKDSLASLLLQSIRDEVHRFAVSYQKIVRKKQARKSVLDDITGLGPKKKKKLLQEFGSVRGMVEAGERKVALVVGKKLAREIFELT